MVFSLSIQLKLAFTRADLGGGGGGAWSAEAPPPPKFYNEQARKLLEDV